MRDSTIRASLVSSAIKLFSQKGYGSTSPLEIVRDAGVSTGSFYVHFKDKHQLLIVLAREHFMSRLQSLKTEDEPAILNRVDKNVLIYKLLHLYVAQKDLYPGFHNEVESMCAYDSELSEILSIYHNGMIELTQGLLNQYSGQLEVHDVPIAAVIVNLIASRAAHAVSHGEGAERIMGELVTLLKRYLFFEKG